MKNNLLKFILTLTLATIFIPNAVYAIGVTPLRVALQAKPGETVEGYVIVQNTLEEDQIAVLSKADFFVNQDESVQFYPTKTTDENSVYSMQDWIEIEENNILIPAKQGKEIKYKITVPADAPSQGYYGAIFISGQSPDKGKTPGALTVEANVAQLVLFQVPGNLKSDIELKSYDMEVAEAQAGKEGSEVEFTAVVHNTGNTHVASTGTITIIDQETKEKQFEQILVNKDKYNTMPNRDKTYVTPWNYSKLEPGGYIALISLELDSRKIADAETPFVINENGEIEIGKTLIKEITEKPLPPVDYTPWIVGGGLALAAVGIISFVALRPKKNAKK
jgi:hypothetical protein